MEAPRKRRSDGEASRKAILQEAARLATVEGINGLSIGRLAEAVGMSKSGLFAHFGSKEELQLATIETAHALFHELVIEPALVATTALGRLRQLIELFLRHVENKVYPGGCFYVSVGVELGAQSGPVRDEAVALSAEWMRLVVDTIQEAQAEGSIDCGGRRRAARVRPHRLSAPRQHAVCRHPGPGSDRPGTPRGGTPARSRPRPKAFGPRRGTGVRARALADSARRRRCDPAPGG